MSLRTLGYFVVVSEELNFSNDVARLHIAGRHSAKAENREVDWRNGLFGGVLAIECAFLRDR